MGWIPEQALSIPVNPASLYFYLANNTCILALSQADGILECIRNATNYMRLMIIPLQPCSACLIQFSECRIDAQDAVKNTLVESFNKLEEAGNDEVGIGDCDYISVFT